MLLKFSTDSQSLPTSTMDHNGLVSLLERLRPSMDSGLAEAEPESNVAGETEFERNVADHPELGRSVADETEFGRHVADHPELGRSVADGTELVSAGCCGSHLISSHRVTGLEPRPGEAGERLPLSSSRLSVMNTALGDSDLLTEFGSNAARETELIHAILTGRFP